MKVLVDKNSKVVIDIRDQANIVSNGIDVGGLIYAQVDLIDIFDVATIPSGVQPQSYCYDATNGFTANPNYVQPTDINAVIDYVQKQTTTATDAYNALDKVNMPLSQLQSAKIAQLYEDLRNSILTFKSSALGTAYTYLGDQLSMSILIAEYAYVRSSDYKGETIKYYNEEQGRVAHTGAQLAQVFLDGRSYFASQWDHYDTLSAQVSAATTNAAVDAINW